MKTNYNKYQREMNIQTLLKLMKFKDLRIQTFYYRETYMFFHFIYVSNKIHYSILLFIHENSISISAHFWINNKHHIKRLRKNENEKTLYDKAEVYYNE